MHPMLNIAIQAARNAARIIVRFVDRLDMISTNEKNRNNFITQVDKLSEEEIIYTIRKAYPNHTIFSEEMRNQQYDNDYTWIVDPIDGTTNFIHGFPQFAISIALKYRETLEIGLIYDPLRQELFTASRGSGAQINNRKIRVSSSRKLIYSLIGTSFPFKKKELFPTYIKTFKDVLLQSSGIRRAGATALDLAYIAAGRLDGFWAMSLQPWDTAAGILLITEAGGLVSDFTGGKEYIKNGNIIAGNPRIHKLLLEIVSVIYNESH